MPELRSGGRKAWAACTQAQPAIAAIQDIDMCCERIVTPGPLPPRHALSQAVLYCMTIACRPIHGRPPTHCTAVEHSADLLSMHCREREQGSTGLAEGLMGGLVGRAMGGMLGGMAKQLQQQQQQVSWHACMAPSQYLCAPQPSSRSSVELE